MKDTSWYEQILGLQKPWRVGEVMLNVAGQRVDLWLEHSGASRACKLYDHSAERKWRHLDTCQFQALIRARVPRVDCPACGVKQVDVAWAQGKVGFTLLMERLIIDLLGECRNIKGVCEILDIHWETCFRVMHKAVERGKHRKGRNPPGFVGVDEKAFRKGHSYMTLVSDLEKGTVEWVAANRETVSLHAYYQQLSEEDLERIEAVVMDMWRAYTKATRARLADALVGQYVSSRTGTRGLIRSQLEPIKKAARKLQRHVTGIATYCRHPFTNAAADGINSKIMAVKRLVGGFRNTEYFKTAIYFYCGGLDLYPR